MAWIEVRCVLCKHNKVRKHGKIANGTQRYKCYNDNCTRKTFVLQILATR